MPTPVRIFFVALCIALASAVALAAADWWTCLPEGARAEYVGRQSCASCHVQETADWAGSDHDLAMDRATERTVLGDFDDAEFDHYGLVSRMFRRDGDFFISTDGPEGSPEPFQIKYVFGVRPLQQYLVEFDDGRVQVLPVAWDTVNQRWFHIYPDEQIPHSDILHWTRPAQNWNYMCAECHSTDVQKNYDLADNTYHTTFAEIDVSCETCHGPGSLHVQLAEANSLFWDRRIGYGLPSLKSEDAKIEIETCAPCHSRRRVVHPDHQAGEPFLDHYAPELLDGDHYHVDGQINEEVYVYGSFLQSRMYREGVRCTDCHQPHTTRLRADGNKLCGRCHTPAKYDNPSHHHHEIGSTGARCVECHMPESTYMVVDPRRDHSLRVPRPDLSVELGTPNACNNCHEDEDAQWAAAACAEWYGTPDERQPHFAHAIAAGRRDEEDADRELVELLKRSDVGPVVRASAASMLGRYDSLASREAVAEALADSEPMVRASAVRAIEGQDPDQLRRLLVPLLDDPVRWPRVEAARLLSVVPRSRIRTEDRPKFDAALEEYRRGQLANADQPASHLNLGVLHENLGESNNAEEAYRTALAIDEGFNPARNNLAMLYDRLGRKGDAEAQFREAIRHDPESAQAHYSLGLLLAERPDQFEETVSMLGAAARLAPDRARIRYNHGLALHQLGRLDEAADELRAAADLDEQDADAIYALALVYAGQGKWELALREARRLVELRPTDPQVKQFVAQLEAQSRQPAVLGPEPPK